MVAHKSSKANATCTPIAYEHVGGVARERAEHMADGSETAFSVICGLKMGPVEGMRSGVKK